MTYAPAHLRQAMQRASMNALVGAAFLGSARRNFRRRFTHFSGSRCLRATFMIYRRASLSAAATAAIAASSALVVALIGSTPGRGIMASSRLRARRSLAPPSSGRIAASNSLSVSSRSIKVAQTYCDAAPRRIGTPRWGNCKAGLHECVHGTSVCDLFAACFQ